MIDTVILLANTALLCLTVDGRGLFVDLISSLKTSKFTIIVLYRAYGMPLSSAFARMWQDRIVTETI